MKTLMIARTYFSLMVCLNIAYFEFSDDTIDLILTDACVGSEQVAQRLKDSRRINKVYYVRTKDFKNDDNNVIKNKYNLFRRYLRFYISPEYALKKMANVEESYDRLFVFQVNIDLELCAYNYCYKNNKNIELYLYEEAYLSYFADDGALKVYTHDIIDKMSIFSKAKNMRKNITAAYYFEPNFIQYKPYFQARKILRGNITNKEFVSELNRVFNYKPVLGDNIDTIYVEDGHHNNGIDIGDQEVAEKLYNFIGDRMIIKLHPRSCSNRFEELGVQLINRNDVPLELIILNCNRPLKLVSMYSSGIISSTLFCSDLCSYFLFPCSEKKELDMGSRIERLVDIFDNCRILYSINEVQKYV